MALSVKRLDRGSLTTLAHPLRVRIVGSLRLDGPATATLLGARLGESSGLTSYHVRVLAQHGFVEEAPGRGNGRERWWRAAQQMTSWQPEDFQDDPDERAAEGWLTGFTARRGMEWLDDWLSRRSSAGPAWLAASDTSDYLLDLSPAELQALVSEISEVVLRHRDAALAAEPEADAGSGPAHENEDDASGRRQVRLLVYAFPRPMPEEPGYANDR